MKKYLKIFYVILLINYLSSCNNHTSISFREYSSQENSKQDGYMFSCFVDGRKLIIETYTPGSWGEDFYYDYLEGRKSKHEVIIIDTKIKFFNTGDTLALKEIRKNGTFIYISKHFKNIIENNEQLRLTIFMKQDDDSTIIKKNFLLNKHEDTYSTGTFPHS